MDTKDYTKSSGRIKKFNIAEEILLTSKIDKNKPSSLILRTKKGKKAINALIDLEKNNNHSWYTELKNRSKSHPTSVALFYRGNKIDFKTMFEKADLVAKAMVECGINQNDEIPVCLANTPELVYILLAANKIGAKLNLFSSNLPKEYLNIILNDCSDKLFICTDNMYSNLSETLSNKNFKNKIMVSLADSLLDDPTTSDEYEPELDSYYHYPNLANKFIKEDPTFISFDDFCRKGKNSDANIHDNNTLDTDFLITYTSGSTKIGYPKQIIHSNRSLIISGRFHDSELSGNPEIRNLRGLAHIHSDSNTNLITCISDNLMQLWSVALEPEYDKKLALDYVLLNKPNYLNATTSFLIEMSKQYLIDKKFHASGTGRKFSFLLAAFAVGEPTSKGEEKFINQFLRESKAGSGVKISGISLPYTTLCLGGGDCEHGGIYYTLWHSWFEKINYLRLKNKEYGLMPEAYAQVSAFKKQKNGVYDECNFNEYGIIAANSATTMVGYKNNKQKTCELILTDNLGRDWVSSNVYGYIDELGGVHVKGRINNYIEFSNGMLIPNFILEDLICNDTKNILSCTITQYKDGEINLPIINLELQPFKQKNVKFIIESIVNRIKQSISNNITDELWFRIFSNEESFPITDSGKRSTAKIECMGVDKIFNKNFESYNKEKIKCKQKVLKKD